MMIRVLRCAVPLCLFFVSSLLASLAHAHTSTLLDEALAGEHRDPANSARDRFRNPKQTLLFFGLEPDMTVVEIWPARGWYTEVLAPVLKERGNFFAAGFSLVAKRPPQWRRKVQLNYLEKLGAHPRVYGRVIATDLSVPDRTEIAPPGSADLVLTFRNVHNWMKGQYAPGVFDAMYRALKPGGMLGVVEHRAKPGTSLADMVTSGYVTEAHVIQLAHEAGFILDARSEINANPLDTANHPKGVWTLPPSLRLGEQYRDKYLAIGESDRMTLRFRKP